MNTQRPSNANRRRGTSMIECVVSASILIVAMGTVTTMAFRLSRVWIQTGHQRIAMNELTNQIERLIESEPDKIDAMISDLKPSPAVERSLDQPHLSGRRVNDGFGDRVTLQLQWRSTHPIGAVELTGWIDPIAEESK